MKSVSNEILIEFEGTWLPPEITPAGLEIGTDWTYRPDERRVHEGIIRSTNHGRLAKDYPNDLKIGDRVRCYYNAIDLVDPLIRTGDCYQDDKAIYSITLHEVLHRINPDGSADMQCGWVAGEIPPLRIPPGMKMVKHNNAMWWAGEATGLVHKKVDLKEIKNRMILRHQGDLYVDDWDFENGDTVLMEEHCEFPNNGHNMIQGKAHWFARQENIIGRLNDMESEIRRSKGFHIKPHHRFDSAYGLDEQPFYDDLKR